MRRALTVAPFAALALLLALFFAPLAASGRAFVFRDLVVYEAGQDRVLREALLERHELPARNPYAYLGVAHLADPATQSLYPPRVLCALLFPVPRSLDVAILLHFAIAAAGAYRLGRALRTSRAASFAGAATYALSGPVLSLQENLPLLAGAAWLPFALAFALEAGHGSTSRRRSRLALAGLAIALAALGGDAQAATWASVLAVLVVGLRALQKSKPTARVRSLTEALGPPALGFGLAAALLLPAARLQPETDRRDPLPVEVAGKWRLAPVRACELLVPFPFGVSFPDGETAAAAVDPDRLPEPWCESIHVGLLGLVLGVAGLGAREGRRRRLACAGLALAGYLLALGSFGPLGGALSPWRILREIVPFYGVFRYPEKHVVLLALGLSGLVALGVQALASESGRRRALFALLGTGVALAAGAFAFFDPIRSKLVAAGVTARPGPRGEKIAQRLAHALPLEVALACAAVLVPAIVLPFVLKNRRAALGLMAALVALDVAVALRPRLYLGDASLYDAHPLGSELVRGSGARLLRWPWGASEPIGRVPAAEEQPGRRLRERADAGWILAWTGNVAAGERVQAVQGFSSFVPLAVKETLPGPELPAAETLDRLGVRWLIVDVRLAKKQGLAPVASSSTGVALVDRGASVPLPPAPDFAGEVPGLALGSAVSAFSLGAWAWLVWRGRRRSRARRGSTVAAGSS